MICLFTFL